MPYRNYKKSKKVTKSKRVYKKRVIKKPSMVKLIKKVIHSQIENKKVGYVETNIALAYAGSVTSPTYINLCPNIIQGTTSGTRIGDSVNVMKGSVRGFVNLYPYNSVNNLFECPIKIKMWLCRRKSGTGSMAGVLTPPTIATWNNFFQIANVPSGFTGGILDTLKYPNTETFTVFSTKTIELSPSMINIATPVTQTLGASGRVSAPFSFDFGKHLGKLLYNDSNQVPQNKELFLVFQTVWANGTIPLLGSFAEVHYVVEHEFEDA